MICCIHSILPRISCLRPLITGALFFALRRRKTTKIEIAQPNDCAIKCILFTVTAAAAGTALFFQIAHLR